jgi:hypothetical protein
VGSKTIEGVWFISYSHDHLPPHVHGIYGSVEVLIDLLADGSVARSQRRDAVRAHGRQRGDIRHILQVAAAHASELHELWEKTHG